MEKRPDARVVCIEMDLKEKMARFNKRWNVTTQDTYEESFLKFKQRILNVFKNIDNCVKRWSIKEFCQFYGIKEEWHEKIVLDPYEDPTWSTNIIDRLTKESDEIEFYKLIELILSLDFEKGREIFIFNTANAIELSDVNVSIDTSTDEIVFFPKGEKLLDEELINNPLSFLNKESSEHFIDALKFYQVGKNVKSAESLRRSLEEFLKYKFSNQKGLKANLDELNKKLKDLKKDPQLRNIMSTNFGFLDQYFNENSKHNDGDIDESENEFLIYQVGLLSRYISKINL